MKKLNSILSLQQLKLNVYLGWPDAERRQKQTVWLDIHLQFKQSPKACLSDRLSDTICYDELTQKIKAKVAKKTFRLIEHLTCEIYLLIKETIAHANVYVCLTKKPPIAHLKKVTFGYGDPLEKDILKT